MLTLYPAIQPYAVHQISVAAPHILHVEECGNSKGLPIVFIHGGPGGGCNEDHRRFFDPNVYRIVLFDQRGAGQSTPHAELEGNTTQELVSDMETIRQKLGIDRWVLFGGSWGSTLALVYAETHPERVISMIVRGIFLCRPEDLDWFYAPGGASRIFPEAWEDFLKPLSTSEQKHIVQSYYKHLTGKDEVNRMAVAKAWSRWEAICATLLPSTKVVDYLTSPHTAISLARIEAHYFINRAFLQPNQILRDINKIADIPGIIVHGRYDMCCAADNAYALHQAWAMSELNMVPDAGHAASELGITNALVAATNAYGKRFHL